MRSSDDAGAIIAAASAAASFVDDGTGERSGRAERDTIHG
jgi:hypothetical protein